MMTATGTRQKAREALAGKWGKGALITLIYLIFSSILSALTRNEESKSAISLIIRIMILIINIPISYGLIVSFIKLKRNEEIGYFDFFKYGFNNFSRAWGIVGNVFLKMIVPILLIIIATIIMVFALGTSIIYSMSNNSLQSLANIGAIGIIGIVLYIAAVVFMIAKSMLYSLSNYIAYDNPEKSTKECVEESSKLMKGNRWKLFILELSFIVYVALPLFILLLLPGFWSHDLSSALSWALLAVSIVSLAILFIIPYLQVSIVCFYEEVSQNRESNETEINLKK